MNKSIFDETESGYMLNIYDIHDFQSVFHTRMDWKQLWGKLEDPSISRIINIWLGPSFAMFKIIYVNYGLGRVKYYNVTALDRNLNSIEELRRLYDCGNCEVKRSIAQYLRAGNLRYDNSWHCDEETQTWFMSLILGGEP